MWIQIAQAKEQFLGEKACTGMLDDTAVSCAKMTEPIKTPFGLWTWVGPRKHVFGGVHTGATLRIPLNSLHAVVMRPFCQITLTTCYHHHHSVTRSTMLDAHVYSTSGIATIPQSSLLFNMYDTVFDQLR